MKPKPKQKQKKAAADRVQHNAPQGEGEQPQQDERPIPPQEQEQNEASLHIQRAESHVQRVHKLRRQLMRDDPCFRIEPEVDGVLILHLFKTICQVGLLSHAAHRWKVVDFLEGLQLA